MSKKRKNAGEGYGYMFSGAFAKKSDAMKKERSRKGSFIKGVYVNGQHRYAVMTPRTNPRKKRTTSAEEANRYLLHDFAHEWANATPQKRKQLKKKAERMARLAGRENPTELMVMAANPNTAEHEREITVPAGSTITIRMNPVNPDRYTSAHARAGGHARTRGGLIESPLQRRLAKMLRKASGSEGARISRSYKRHKASSRSRGTEKVFHEIFGTNPAPICGHMVSGEPCTRKPGHKGPHLPQGATMRPRSRLRHAWKPRTKNPSAAALHETFTGKEGKYLDVYDEPHMPAGDYAQLGELLALYFKPIDGGQVQQITFPRGGRPVLVASENARQIYFVGGDQGVPLPGGTLGECRRIDYKQRKEHVPDPELDEWRHEFGEESGIRPMLCYDAASQRLRLEGGDYRIRAEGIIN